VQELICWLDPVKCCAHNILFTEWRIAVRFTFYTGLVVDLYWLFPGWQCDPVLWDHRRSSIHSLPECVPVFRPPARHGCYAKERLECQQLWNCQVSIFETVQKLHDPKLKILNYFWEVCLTFHIDVCYIALCNDQVWLILFTLKYFHTHIRVHLVCSLLQLESTGSNWPETIELFLLLFCLTFHKIIIINWIILKPWCTACICLIFLVILYLWW